MWHQHLCLLGCLAASLVFIETCLLHQIQFPVWLEPNLPDLEFEVTKRLNHAIKKKVAGQTMGSLLCLTYWAAAYVTAVFPPKLTRKQFGIYTTVSFLVWHVIIQPYLFVALLYSVYFGLTVVQELGTLQYNLEDHWRRTFEHIRRNSSTGSSISSYTAHLERIQREFHCCGAVSLSDWDGVDPTRIGLKSTWFSRGQDFTPWQQLVLYLPPSCCDPHATPFCSYSEIVIRQGQMVDREPQAYPNHIPVYRLGCIEAMFEHVGKNLSQTLRVALMADIFIHVLQVGCCFCVYHVQKPAASVQLPDYETNQSAYVDIGEEQEEDYEAREEDIESHSMSSKDVGRYDGQKEEEEQVNCKVEQPTKLPLNKHKVRDSQSIQSYRLLGSAYGYISNAKLLSACQSLAFIGQPSQIHQAFSKTKSLWLEKGIQIGWTLRDRMNTYATFIRPIRWKSKFTPGQLEWSGFRYWLRSRLPLVEALIYADGNVTRELEGNIIYGCLLSYILRVICCLVLGYLVSSALIAAFVPKGKAKEVKDSEGAAGTEEKIRRDAVLVAQEVAWITSLFIHVTVMFGAVISRRVRCLLFMLVPSLGLTVGQSYLGAELVHTVLTGPAATTERNLRAAVSTLQCLMELSKNVTREAKQFYEESKESVKLDNAKDYYSLIQQKSEQFTESVEAYRESADKLMKQIAQSEEFAKRAESVLKRKGSDSSSTGYGDVDKADEDRRNRLLQLTQRLTDRDAQNSNRSMGKSQKRLKQLMSKMNMDGAMIQGMAERIQAGTDIENMIKRRMIATCMVFHNTRGSICSLAAVNACDRLQLILSLVFLYPVLIKYPCIWQVSKGVACPTSEAMDQAVQQCGSTVSNIGMGPGYGAMFYQSIESLNQISEAFRLNIQSPLIGLPKLGEWVSERKAVISEVAKKTKESVQIMFRLSLLTSTLLKLLSLLVFRKASNYISNYLTDVSFDNIYIERAFEAIDAKRLKQHRETLLPLKNFERKKYFWRKKVYTKSELSKAIVGCLKAFGLGFVLNIFFFIDAFIADTIHLLDIATDTEIHLGAKMNGTSDNVPEPPHIEGDGIFRELIENTITVLTHISQLDISVNLKICSPRVQITEVYYWQRFGAVWACMLLIGFLSGYLLRARHMILDFFYPFRQNRRAVHLYNSLLVDRRRHMTICRNLLVHHTRENRLQAEARERSEAVLLQKKNPLLARLLGKSKVACFLCNERFKPSHFIQICPYDDTPICRSCKHAVFRGKNTCIVCLDRDPAKLFEERRHALQQKQALIAKLEAENEEDDEVNNERRNNDQQESKDEEKS
ncbi:hypothetical protein EG68_02980 [Paragonimus skrjabini miyazakii]|uniref:Dendritic cell-specific transmembrane protein-like domain-containing protein n=1 Tax=Paragonimus skrjabini miyazakii TaxID=59628 RepID=A0A8S9Z254_9TREM|nr:hypothetical protein EG68_02980 [Paragonimus skrjabini miyazakii]